MKALKEHYSSYRKYGLNYLRIIISGNSWLHLFLLFLCFFGLLNLFPIGIKATSTYYQNNELYLTGKLIYVGSSSGYDPVDNLNGETHRIYLNGEAERNLAKDPYLTNMCTENVEGWIDSGYEISIPYSDRLHVIQPLYTANNSTRSGTAYYDVEVETIQTNLLYRPDRNNTYITLVVCGLILLSIWCVIKGVRHD